jgi:hypothetical protein
MRVVLLRTTGPAEVFMVLRPINQRPAVTGLLVVASAGWPAWTVLQLCRPLLSPAELEQVRVQLGEPSGPDPAT